MGLIIMIGALIIIGFAFLIKETHLINFSYHHISKKSNTNFTVVQLSDIHGKTRFLNGSISEIVNRIKPDYVFVTGDLASRKKQLHRVVEEIGKIKCENIIFVPGNYERETLSWIRKREYSQEEYNELIRSLENKGVTVLENKSITSEINNRQLLIYGFDNSQYGKERLNMSRDDWQNSDCVILLAHSPSIIRFIEENKLHYDLLLVGHTHGGQIRLFDRTIGAFKHCHVGLRRMDDQKHFYINRGLGTVKLPFRLASPPEIAVFKIET